LLVGLGLVLVCGFACFAFSIAGSIDFTTTHPDGAVTTWVRLPDRSLPTCRRGAR
jgi:hypothetical protein